MGHIEDEEREFSSHEHEGPEAGKLTLLTALDH
jgi:hypothetical protein